MALGIIGAGFGRTGTLSLKQALERLLGQPCYHMFEVFSHPEHADVWRRAAEGQAVDFDEVLAGYGATVDWPACEFWRELMAAYPEAKVLLSVRDPDRWYSSFSSTIERLLRRSLEGEPSAEVAPIVAMAERVIIERSFDGKMGDRADFIAAFARHNSQVQARVGPDRLLVYDVTEGWEPLCRFIGAPVPDEPFPNVNDRGFFQAMFGLEGQRDESGSC
jgi:hypothetical protein